MLEQLDGTSTIKKHIWVTFAFILLVICILFYYQWILGVFVAIGFLFVCSYVWIQEKQEKEAQIAYIKKLSYQVEQAGEEVFLQVPFGIVIYDQRHEIEWVNPYMERLFPGKTLTKEHLTILSEDLIANIHSDEEYGWLKLDHLFFRIKIEREYNTIYLFDRTNEKRLEQLYYNEHIVLGHIYLDNYEEISRNLSDNVKSQLNSRITAVLDKWAVDYGFYLKRTSQDRFMAVLTQETLDALEKSRFEILDEVRKITLEEAQRNPITISIGIGVGNVEIPELAQLAQSSLDLALGRGGDQIAIRDETGKVRFYGGKTNPMEKRTRVRARVISHALIELVKESDNVIIMGHKSPDMDSLGATIGVLNIAKSNDVEGYIVFDEDDVLTGVSRVIAKVKQEESLWKHFIGPDEADAIFTSRSLIVVVDTHRPALVAHERLVHKAEHKVVIDHHRRGEDFIEDPTLVYMEPYASSTSELVTELIEYQPKKKKLSTLEATALLAGIIVDTKSFALRTGSRTFDAASYLRSKGADPILIQDFLKEDLSMLIKRNKLIEYAYMYRDSIAISKSNPEDGLYNQITIAQAADTLLTVDHVAASFVIAMRSENTISISARSLGDVNVQLIMEEMDGGGHLTNAATQIKDATLDEVETRLKETIEDYFEGRT